MKKISHFAFLFIFIIFLFIPATLLQAGTTGKIAGIVKDTENGEPLPGVNVFLEGTSLGAATDTDGFYYIINVPPGSYTLEVNYIGYAAHQITDVVVRIDLTTNVDIELKPEILLGETVTVVAQRPVVTRDISNSQMNVEAEVIETLPVQTVDQVLILHAGVELGSRGILVRGGGADETVFMVDGLSQNDERSNYPYTAVSLSSVEELQLQTGGFNAEYGQARSGIVNVVTKEGGRKTYNGTVTFRISPPTKKHFGPSIYDPFSFFNRPYFDPDVMWTGTQNGAWDDYTQRQYPRFHGWIAESEALLADDDPTNDLTPEGAKRVFEWYRRRQGDIEKPDYVVDIGFGGPIPFLSENIGDLRFFISYFKEQEMFVFPLSRDGYGDEHIQIKLTSDINPAMKLMITGLYGEEHSVSPYSWTTTPTGYLLRGQSEIANLTSGSNTGQSIPFMPGYYSPGSIYRTIIGAKFTHTLSSSTIYEARLQHKYSKHSVFQMEERDVTKKYEIVPGYFVDEAPYGYYGYATTGIAGAHLGGWMNLGRDNSDYSTTTVGLDYTSQLDLNNQLKAGFEYVYNDFNIISSTESPSMGTWTRSMIYRVFPFRFGVYIQDKLEFQDFIANVGIRYDYSNSNSKFYSLNPYDDYYQAGYGNQIEEEAPTEDSKPFSKISPRIGISHPITVNSKLYFNYGHFVQEPASSYRFRLQRESNGLVTYMGNPNMILEKTIQYELGYEHNLFDMLLLKVAGYYKDVSDQPGWIYYQNINGTVQYWMMENNNYADIRGVEFSVTKRVGKWLSGFINYTYHVSTSGYYGLLRYYEDPNEQRDYLRNNPYQTRPHPRPFATVNIDFHSPVDYGPAVSGFYPLGGWNVNLAANWKTGQYETYNPENKPGLVDNVQWKDWYNVDLRLTKLFRTQYFDVQLYLDVRNLFNFKYMSEAGFSDIYDRYDYLTSLNFSWEEGVEKGDDRFGDYRPDDVSYDPLEFNPDNDPDIKARNDKRKETKSYIDNPNITSLTFLNPRDIYFGIRINF